MNRRTILFSPPDISDSEVQEVCAALKSGWITTGPRTKLLEARLAQFCNTDKVVCLNSATAALELTLRILGIGEGDEVIVPAYTYTATAAPVVHVGATLRMVDIQPNHFEMDYTQLEGMINERTKAIIPVDIGGVLCDYEKLLEIVNSKKSLFKARNYIQSKLGRIAIIADSAHGLGAKRKGKTAGEWADFTTFSFHAVKNLTTGEGGAVTWLPIDGVTDDEIYQQFQLYSLHGQSKDALAKTQLGAWEYDIVAPLYKCNMTDIVAAIGLKQLDRYLDMLDIRHQIIRRYNELMDELGVAYLPHATPDSKSSGHLYTVRIPDADETKRNELILQMAEEGVACNVHYKPLPMLTAYKNMGFSIENYPNSYHYYCNLLTLPLHTKLSEEDVDYVLHYFDEIYTMVCLLGKGK